MQGAMSMSPCCSSLVPRAIGPSSPQCHAQSVLALLHTIEVVEIEMPIVPGFEWRQQSNLPGAARPCAWG